MQYIYIYLDPRKSGKYQYDNLNYCFLFEPFYVGKGTKKSRMFEHLSEAYSNRNNSHKCNIIRKIKKEIGLKPIILKLIDGLNESEANELEIKFIKNIGRMDLKTGPLTNKTIGGEGLVGLIMTEERRKKISLAKSGSNHPRYGLIGELNPLYGIKQIDSHKLKIGSSNQEYKYKIEDTCGNVYYADSLQKFSISKNLNPSSMNKVSNGIYPSYKGWSVTKIECTKTTKRGHVSESTRIKMSLSKKKFIYKIISPDKSIYENINNLKEFCLTFNLNLKSVYNSVRLGVDYRGWNFQKDFK